MRSSWLMAAVRRFAWWLLLAGSCCLCQQEQAPTPGSFLVSSIDHPRMRLPPYDWTYIRVELPAWFSSLTMKFTSNVHSDAETIRRHPKSMPIMCFRQGGPPLPDVSDASLNYLSLNFTYDRYLERTQGLQGADWCLSFQKNMTLTLTNEQMSPGVWYIGFFNGLGPERTQSKMIKRGPTYVFSILLSIEGCRSSTIWGPYCNQTMNPLSCGQPGAYKHSRSLSDVMYDSAVSMNSPLNVHYHSLHKSHFAGIKRISLLSDKIKESSGMDHSVTYNRLILCNNSLEAACIGLEDVNFYSLDILDPSSRLEIVAENFKLTNMTSVNSTEDSVNTLLMCYVRYNAMPLKTFYDFSADISRNSLVIQLPQIGRWYIAIRALNNTELKRGTQNALAGAILCFSLHWEVHTCPFGKAGLNCAANLHFLQRIYREDPEFPIRSYYLPFGESSELAMLLLEPLLSNSSIDGTSDGAWTYLILDIPRGAAGANLHVQLVSKRRVEYEVYAKYGGLPSTVSWNYHVNSTSNSNSSMMLMSSDSEETIDFYILYVREGPWVIGLKHASNSQRKLHTMISISLEACPKHCSSHGSCLSTLDETGLSSYSFCYCDRVRGGLDCSNELISHHGHVQQSIFLIASNAAALFPAFWSLHQKAFAEWVLFTASGISSGLYHACDVGTWCALSFHVLQFMDFWLSFMAVVSTFVFMATINEASKRAIHMCVTIITALLAVTGATRSANIILVIAIGALSLVIAWVLEFSSANRTNIFLLQGCSLNINERWQTSRIWLHGVVQRLHKRFHWHFLLIACILLSAAGISWKLESNKTYWIWHSLWHITIYTSSFFFLCSVRSSSRQYEGTVEYALSQRNSPILQQTETEVGGIS